MSLSPCRVSQGSWWVIVLDSGVIKPDRPPVDTTAAYWFSSSWMRVTMLSTRPV